MRAWNGHAPRATLRWLGGRHAYGAYVYVTKLHTATGTVGGPVHTASGPECVFDIWLRGSRFLSVEGVWKSERVTGWSGELRPVLDYNTPQGAPESASVGADGKLRLFSAALQELPTTFPGLPSPADQMDPAFTPAPGPAPTAAQCVRAWNQGAPAATRSWIVSLRPYGASVYHAGTSVDGVAGPICVFGVSFGHVKPSKMQSNSQYVEVDGVWKRGTVTGWGMGHFPGTYNTIVVNAVVRGDGGLKLFRFG